MEDPPGGKGSQREADGIRNNKKQPSKTFIMAISYILFFLLCHRALKTTKKTVISLSNNSLL